ncbi:OmpH family outer membrane protein [Mucilaginibacter hurinus]|uniref:OmpH family outer membrane protein n=1 Tax=Mucilaginibacter hurinus TaxID=2201324 RepID=A0A367GU19_9SPHI|nr:OmpH family outer membrane protein [Mucilaginibacter hurinus]RCH56565.1 OmpH family outer membrane protein [Mucilaginibacter hurinus]
MTHKASIFSKLTLGILVAGTIAACNQNKPAADKPAATTTASTPAATPTATIVYVQQDSLLAKYGYAKDLSDRLQKKGRSAESDLVSRKQAFQREVAEYQKDANTMSAEQRAPIEQRLQRKGQELQTYEQNATAQFQNESGNETEKLYNKIVAFTKKYAKEKGYKMILTHSKANPIMYYGDESLDVTADVVKGLNAEYDKEKK